MSDTSQRIRDRLSAAFRTAGPMPKRRPPFEADPTMERLLALKEADPAAFAKLTPRQKISAAHYLEHKRAHEEEQG